ncbi:MAG: type 1 glutamine amidotransferase [Phycisphaeraceae bacterium]|nr:type 1 glutamine amidotransferase [Phycisphaeraceae bacterium]
MRTLNLHAFLPVAIVLAAALSASCGPAEQRHGVAPAITTADMPFAGMRVAVLTGEGFHDGETMMPIAFLVNRGAQVTVIGPETGRITAYNNDVHLHVHQAVSDVRAADFDALVLPGGQAPDRIRQNEDVVAFARDFYGLGRPIAAICHGPQILITAEVVQDREMTCIAGVADELREAGADYRDEAVVRDGHLITSRLPEDIPQWLAALEEAMGETATTY